MVDILWKIIWTIGPTLFLTFLFWCIYKGAKRNSFSLRFSYGNVTGNWGLQITLKSFGNAPLPQLTLSFGMLKRQARSTASANTPMAFPMQPLDDCIFVIDHQSAAAFLQTITEFQILAGSSQTVVYSSRKLATTLRKALDNMIQQPQPHNPLAPPVFIDPLLKEQTRRRMGFPLGEEPLIELLMAAGSFLLFVMLLAAKSAGCYRYCRHLLMECICKRRREYTTYDVDVRYNRITPEQCDCLSRLVLRGLFFRFYDVNDWSHQYVMEKLNPQPYKTADFNQLFRSLGLK